MPRHSPTLLQLAKINSINPYCLWAPHGPDVKEPTRLTANLIIVEADRLQGSASPHSISTASNYTS